jgi:hypothetical protein
LSWPSTIIPAEDTAVFRLAVVAANDFGVVAARKGTLVPVECATACLLPWLAGRADAPAMAAGPTRPAPSAAAASAEPPSPNARAVDLRGLLFA